MKKSFTITVVFLILGATTQAQEDPGELSKLGDALRERISKTMPGWKHRSIEPIEGSRGVAIQQWELGEISVKVAVTQYQSEAKAAEDFTSFKAHVRIEEEATRARRGRGFRRIKEDSLPLGDEGVVWDIRGSEALSFRKGRWRVDISIARPEQSNDVHFCRVFAAHVAGVLQHQ